MSNPHILLVDDHKLTCRMISSLVSDLGFHVLNAYSGEEALKILNEHTVSVLVTDYEMPTMTGLELFKEAKRSHILLRGILCTGRLPMSQMPEIIAMGFDDCIPKSMVKELLGESVLRAAQNGDRWKRRAAQLNESNDGLTSA